jgi:hypothetical protein
LLGSPKQQSVENLVFQLCHGSAPITLAATSLERIENALIEMQKALDGCVPTTLAFSMLHPAVGAFAITSLCNVNKRVRKQEPPFCSTTWNSPLFGKRSAPQDQRQGSKSTNRTCRLGARQAPSMDGCHRKRCGRVLAGPRFDHACFVQSNPPEARGIENAHA